MSDKKKWFLSLALLFHLFVLLVMPMQNRSLVYKKGSWIEAYASSLGLIAQWSFFAPDAAEYALFFDWEVLSSGQKLITKGEWPEDPKRLFFSDRVSRQVIMSHFIFKDDVQISKMFVPYLCQQSKDAKKIRLWKRFVAPPSLREWLEPGLSHLHMKNPESARVLVTESYCENRA